MLYSGVTNYIIDFFFLFALLLFLKGNRMELSILFLTNNMTVTTAGVNCFTKFVHMCETESLYIVQIHSSSVTHISAV